MSGLAFATASFCHTRDTRTVLGQLVPYVYLETSLFFIIGSMSPNAQLEHLMANRFPSLERCARCGVDCQAALMRCFIFGSHDPYVTG